MNPKTHLWGEMFGSFTVGVSENGVYQHVQPFELEKLYIIKLQIFGFSHKFQIQFGGGLNGTCVAVKYGLVERFSVHGLSLYPLGPRSLQLGVIPNLKPQPTSNCKDFIGPQTKQPPQIYINLPCRSSMDRPTDFQYMNT